MISESLNNSSKEIQSPVPFWFINGRIEEWQIARELDMMLEKGINELIVHPRYGLDVEYLSEDWFAIFGLCLREAKKRGMKLWIYDELNWPSGTAGMRVQKDNPDLQSKHLSVTTTPLTDIDKANYQLGDIVVAANIEGGRITKTRLIEDRYVLNSLTSSWTLFNFNITHDPYYIDALSTAAVERFRDLTYEEYLKRFGEDFGGAIRAFFTDEPSIYRVSSGTDNRNLPYTADLFKSFEARFGFSPLEKLPYLLYPGDGAMAFRADFWDHAGYLFNQRYHGTLSLWCREHGVIYTGHNHYEEPLRYQIRFQGNMYDSMRAMDIPGVDHLGKATLGNHWISIIGHKICTSQAHISGKARAMSESFGTMDWDTTFTSLKRVVDWQFAQGINLLVPHALYHTISGPTKRECPPSFFYQSPHWRDFDTFTDYLHRMESVLTGGRHACKVAVMYPLSGLWATYQPDRNTPEFEHTGNFLNSLCLELIRNQVDFDLLDFTALSEAKLEDIKIKLGDESYEVLIVPTTPYMRHIEVKRLTQIVNSGVYTAMFHKAMEPDKQSVPDILRGVKFVPGDQLTQFIEILRRQLDDDILIQGGGSDDIMAYRREKDGQKITFLVNRSNKHRKVMAMIKDYPDPAIYDPETGKHTRIEGRRAGQRTQIELRFQPEQSYFIVSNVSEAAMPMALSNGIVSVPISNLKANIPFNVASVYHFTYTKPCIEPIEMDTRTNPRYIPVGWDTNPPDFTQFAGVYEAEIEINAQPERIKLILDADYAACEVFINDTQITLQQMGESSILPTQSGYLMDSADLWADASGALMQGLNRIRIISPTRLSEPVRFVGDFRTHVAGRLVVIVPPGDIDPLQVERDCPFYSGTVTYTADFDLPTLYSSLELVLSEVHDTMEVWLNGNLAGTRLWAPYRLDISANAQVGANKLEIRVRNNMANLLQGTHRPIGFRKAPAIAGYE